MKTHHIAIIYLSLFFLILIISISCTKEKESYPYISEIKFSPQIIQPGDSFTITLILSKKAKIITLSMSDSKIVPEYNKYEFLNDGFFPNNNKKKIIYHIKTKTYNESISFLFAIKEILLESDDNSEGYTPQTSYSLQEPVVSNMATYDVTECLNKFDYNSSTHTSTDITLNKKEYITSFDDAFIRITYCPNCEKIYISTFPNPASKNNLTYLDIFDQDLNLIHHVNGFRITEGGESPDSFSKIQTFDVPGKYYICVYDDGTTKPTLEEESAIQRGYSIKLSKTNFEEQSNTIPGFPDKYEPDNKPDQATLLNFDEIQDHSLQRTVNVPFDMEDWFYFEIK